MSDPAYNISHVQREIDSRVLRRLATDTQYRNAPDAETQSDRETQIELQETLAVLSDRPDGFHAWRQEVQEELDRGFRLGYFN